MTSDHHWTIRVRRGPDDEIIISMGGVGHCMDEAQAERLARWILSCCQGETNDTGEKRL